MSVRLAIVAEPALAALHGLDGSFDWGEARTCAPGEDEPLAAWEPAVVFALDSSPPAGPWRAITWEVDARSAPPLGAPGALPPAGPLLVGTAAEGVWRRAPFPAASGLAPLRERRGAGVLLAGGSPDARESALAKLRARGVEAQAVERLTVETLAEAAVVALLGTPGEPLPDAAPAVLAAGRILVAPHAEPGFGLLPWSDHLAYANEDELACAADMAQTFPDAFEPITALGVLAAEAHAAPAVYGRLALDACYGD